MREKLAKAREVMEKEGRIAKRKKDKKLRESLVGKLRAPPASKPPRLFQVRVTQHLGPRHGRIVS